MPAICYLHIWHQANQSREERAIKKNMKKSKVAEISKKNGNENGKEEGREEREEEMEGGRKGWKERGR